MPYSMNAAEARDASANPPPANADGRRRRFRRWLWRKMPYFIVIMLLTILTLVVFWHRIVIVIEGGHAGVLFRLWSGTQIDYVYPPGLHIINPFNTMHVYETRKQVVFHDFDVLTSKGMTLRPSLAIRYHPEYELLGMLHERIGPDYLKRVIIPQIESIMRKELGTHTAEDIYTNKEDILTDTILSALDEVGRNFVRVEDIIIRSIELPIKIKDAIEDKLTQEEMLKSYEFRVQTASREAERLRIEGEGVRNYHEIIAKSLSDSTLKYQGIQATKELAKSDNSKVIVIGSGKDGLPLILNTP